MNRENLLLLIQEQKFKFLKHLAIHDMLLALQLIILLVIATIGLESFVIRQISWAHEDDPIETGVAEGSECFRDHICLIVGEVERKLLIVKSEGVHFPSA